KMKFEQKNAVGTVGPPRKGMETTEYAPLSKRPLSEYVPPVKKKRDDDWAEQPQSKRAKTFDPQSRISSALQMAESKKKRFPQRGSKSFERPEGLIYNMMAGPKVSTRKTEKADEWKQKRKAKKKKQGSAP